MKRWKRWLLLGLSVLSLTVPARGAEIPREVADALPREAETLLEDVTDWGPDRLTDGLRSLWAHLWQETGALLRCQTRGAASILLVVILCGLVRGAQESAGGELRFLTMAGALAITLLTAGDLDSLMGAGSTVIEQMDTFSRALLPTLAAVSAAAGGAAGATMRQVATVFFADLLLALIHGFLMPMVYLYAGTLAAGSSLGDKRLLAVAGMMRTMCVRLLTGVLLAFTLYLSVSGIFAGTVDAASVRVTKAAISGAVPVVGGIIADAAETMLAGAGVLKGTLGVFGLLGVLALCGYPFLRLGLQYLLYKLTAFLTAAVGDNALCGLIDGLGGAFGLVLGMVGSCALVLLISILASVAAVSG